MTRKKKPPVYSETEAITAGKVGCAICKPWGEKGLVEVHMLAGEQLYRCMVGCECRAVVPDPNTGRAILPLKKYLSTWQERIADHRRAVEASVPKNPRPTGASRGEAMEIFNRTARLAIELGIGSRVPLYSGRYD